MSAVRRRVVAAAAVVVCAAPIGVAQAVVDDQSNRAVATTEQDGTRVFDFAWSLDRQRGGVVNHSNVANAAARCTDCRATAIAFQVVLATGDAQLGTPHNQAVAINDQCTNCVVYAGARQFVRIVEGKARFTGEGRSTLASVRKELRALDGQDLDAAALQAAVEAQEARVIHVLTDEIVTHGDGRRDNEADDS